MAQLLELAAENTRTCRACTALLFFVRHKNGKMTPYTIDGLNHFVNCPHADQFRKGKKNAAPVEAAGV